MNHLRIGWATPWNECSSIAASAAAVADELARRGHELTVLRTEVGSAADLPPLKAPGDVLSLDNIDDDKLRRDFDVIVAQIGDHYPFHGAVLRHFTSLDIVGIFHDAFLATLAAGWASDCGDEAVLYQLVREVYGDAAMSKDEPFWIDLAEMARRRPMLEWLAHRSVAAVAHARHYAERLRRSCPGPTTVIPLALTLNALPTPPPAVHDMTIAAIGRANPNKRIDQVIVAIGASPILRNRCRLRVIGQITEDERRRLLSIATSVGIEPPEFTGWVSDEELRNRLRSVNVICCLRNPILEGASASLILALASGRPTLITSHGCYAEVPDDMAMHCRPEHEALDAMRHIERLMNTTDQGAAMGVRAQGWIKQQHLPTTYVDRLLPLLEWTVASRPWREARGSIRKTLRAFGLQHADPAFRRVDLTLDNLAKR